MRAQNRGHPVATKWVIGGVEIVPDKKKLEGGMFFVVVPNCTMQTLIEVIVHHVWPGPDIIMTAGLGTTMLKPLGCITPR